jgi:PAS domain S-box-containing protein
LSGLASSAKLPPDRDAVETILRTRAVYWLPLAYLVAGIAWITGSDYLLGVLFRGDPGALLFAGSFKGLMFVGVTALLLFVVLYLGVGVARPHGSAGPRRVAAEFWRPLAIFMLAAVGIAVAGVALYRSQAYEIRRNRAAELNAVADLKVSQIEFWLEDRRQGLEQAASSPFFVAAIEEWIESRSPAIRERLDQRLEGIRQADDFVAVQLVGADGSVLASVGARFDPTPEVQREIRRATGAGVPPSTGLYVTRDVSGNSTTIDHVVALAPSAGDPRQPLGHLVARSDAGQHVFPLATAWPLEGSSGESLLIRRDGDYVVALSGIRYPERAPASRRMPLSRTELAGVRAVLGERGPFETYDYRGVPTLAVGVPIRGSDWFLLAKVDLAEVHAPLIRLLFMASGLVAAALIAAAALVLLWWRGEKLRMGLALERAEQRVSALVEHFAWSSRFANDMVVLIDADGRILEANDRTVEAYGYSREELIGRSVFDASGASDAELAEVRRNFAAIKERGHMRYEALHRRRDGSPLPVEISSRRMNIGGRTYVQSIMRDMSERRAQEQRIAEISAERDRLLKRLELQFERMPVGCVFSGPDFRMLQVNAAFERIFGYTREELDRDDAWALIVPPELRAWILEQLAPLATSDASITLVNDNLTKSGQRITCRWTNTPLHGPSGELIGHIGMCEDITQQVQTERALRSSEERFRALAEVSPTVVFRTDTDGQCRYVNSRWREVSGSEPRQALGLGWQDAVHPEDRGRVADAWRRTLAGGTFRQEYRLLRPDGTIAWVLGQATPEFSEDGRITGFVGTVNDITDLKATELELQRSRDLLEQRVRERTGELAAAKERAEHADRVKSTFLSTMSHELRTPLNSILGFTDVVLEGLSGPLTQEQQRHLGIVRESSVHLLGLINDMLDLTRIEAGQLRLEIGEVDLPDLLRRRVEGFEAEAARKGLALATSIGAGVGTLRSDAKRVSQIVDNLVSNAVKFTDEGSVELVARLVGEQVEVAVIATGPGIDPGDLPLIFQPFFSQSTGSPGRMHEGIGLGLPISRHLAAALGGTIRVASEPGHGSRFTLSLPVAGPGAA